MFSAAILAGGRATRFGGQDKGALIVDGRTIREQQIAMLASVVDDLLIVGMDEERWRAGVRVEGDGDRAASRRTAPRLVADAIPGCGPMGGVHAALSNALGDAVLVVACDMPYVTAPLAAHLLDLARDADIVVPRTERGYHPLCAVYTRACLDAVARRIAAHELTMTGLLDEMRVRVLPAEDVERFGDRHRLLANVNTPADYAGLGARHGHKR